VPWKVMNPMDSRMELVLRHRRGERLTDLAREFAISRKTADKFVRRFATFGLEGLADRSRARQSQRHRTSAELEAKILALRKEHPGWGAKKLKVVLERTNPGVRFPARSTIDLMLQRHGLSEPRRRRHTVAPYEGPLVTPTGPNHVWGVDYKGEFRLGNRQLCYPLTSSDLASRFVLGCEALDAIGTASARECFEELFRTYGVPELIRSDNGSPFASSRSLWGLTRLSAFWLSLGIRHERIEPAHPEQNGVHERMHRTLKFETTRPAARNLLAQQEKFDSFIRVFNEMRPHEALGMRTPAEVYRPSTRLYRPAELDYPLHDDAKLVSTHGHVRLGRHQVFLSTALAGYRVGVRELLDGSILLTFAALDLAVFDPRRGRISSPPQTPGTSSAA
jgi:transposase InsO family protein